MLRRKFLALLSLAPFFGWLMALMRPVKPETFIVDRWIFETDWQEFGKEHFVGLPRSTRWPWTEVGTLEENFVEAFSGRLDYLTPNPSDQWHLPDRPLKSEDVARAVKLLKGMERT